MTNGNPTRPTQCQIACLRIADEPSKGDGGPFWNLCTLAHSNLAIDTEVLGGLRARPSEIKARFSKPN